MNTEQKQPKGYEASIRSVSSYDEGFDISITERLRADGTISMEIAIQGLLLTPDQHAHLARILSIWKWGIVEVSPEEAQRLDYLSQEDIEHSH